MMVKVCDRCKKTIPENIEQGRMRTDMDLWINDCRGEFCKTMHITNVALCDECSEEFSKFMEMKE